MTKTNNTNHLHIGMLALAAVFLSAAVLLLNSTKTNAGPFTTAGNNTNPAKCETTGGALVNVTQKIVNDADSGQAGNYWGVDTFNRHIQVFKQTDGSYCANVDYDGKFVGQAGQTSPGATGTLTGSESGTIKGGYSAVINGILKTSPELPVKGSIGTTDYQCDMTGNCPGAFNWVEKYFNTSSTNYAFSYAWWGWTYRSGTHTWVNASTGNSGDII